MKTIFLNRKRLASIVRTTNKIIRAMFPQQANRLGLFTQSQTHTITDASGLVISQVNKKRARNHYALDVIMTATPATQTLRGLGCI